MHVATVFQMEKQEDSKSSAPSTEARSSASEAEVAVAAGPKCLTQLAAQLDRLEASLLSSLAEVRDLRESCP